MQYCLVGFSVRSSIMFSVHYDQRYEHSLTDAGNWRLTDIGHILHGHNSLPEGRISLFIHIRLFLDFYFTEYLVTSLSLPILIYGLLTNQKIPHDKECAICFIPVLTLPCFATRSHMHIMVIQISRSQTCDPSQKITHLITLVYRLDTKTCP